MNNEIIPFITSVTTELNDRIDEIMTLISALTDSIQGYVESVQNAINDVGIKVQNMIEESANNKKYVSEAFSKIVKRIALKLKDISSEINKNISPDVKKSLESSSNIIDLLDKKITDLQLVQVIIGLSSIVDFLNSEVYSKKPEISGILQTEQKVVQTQGTSFTPTKQEGQKPIYYEKGAKTKTMEEILEEQRRRKKMMIKYR